MSKKEALAVLYAKLVNKEFSAEETYHKDQLKCAIRRMSNSDEGFKDVVFELGVSTLAKAYMKDKQ